VDPLLDPPELTPPVLKELREGVEKTEEFWRPLKLELLRSKTERVLELFPVLIFPQ